MMPAALPAPHKPLLRGVSHQVATFAALLGWAALALLAGPRASLAVNVYGASLASLFAVSALYHRPNWRPGPRAWMRRLDHSAIFLLIAGTYTPVCLLLPEGRGHALLWVAWTGALLGVLQSILWVRAPKPLIAVIYLALGWALLPALPTLARSVGAGSLLLLGVGGVLYSVGAVVYALRRPDPFPRVFGYHEVFHALVIAAAACHFAVVVQAVRALR